jgi:hypothetical protein
MDVPNPVRKGIKLFVVLDGLESIQSDRQSSKKNNKYQMLYTYGCTS